MCSGLLPFSIVANTVYRQHVRYESISRPTLSKYISSITSLVEKKVTDMLPEKFALVILGWSESKTHYVSTFSSFSSSSNFKCSISLLGFSPLENELSQGSKIHKGHFDFVLNLYGKSFANVIAIIGDNCASNRKLARIVDKALCGCASHRYNLCVKDIMQKSQVMIEKVNLMMMKLRYLIPAAQLRAYTPLRAKCNNPTRCSSTSAMLCRYFGIKKFLIGLNVDGSVDLLPNPRESKELESLNSLFGQLNSVTKALQREDLTCADVRVLFDGIISEYPDTAARLSSTARISFPTI